MTGKYPNTNKGRIGISHYHDTHKSEIISNPDLLKLNKIGYDQQLLNLCNLFAGNAGKDVGSKYVSLPSNKDVAKLLLIPSEGDFSHVDNADSVKFGSNYVTLISEGSNLKKK